MDLPADFGWQMDQVLNDEPALMRRLLVGYPWMKRLRPEKQIQFVREFAKGARASAEAGNRSAMDAVVDRWHAEAATWQQESVDELPTDARPSSWLARLAAWLRLHRRGRAKRWV